MMSPVRAPGTVWPGGCRKATQGCWIGASKCGFGEAVGADSPLQSPNWCPQWASLLPQSHTDRSLITLHHPTCFSPILCTAPELICLHSSDITWSLCPCRIWFFHSIDEIAKKPHQKQKPKIFSTCAQESRTVGGKKKKR